MRWCAVMGRTGWLIVSALGAFACSKTESEKKPPPAPPPAPVPAGSGSGTGSAEPVEAAAVVGPTKSATGSLDVSGALTGKFEWKKKDQKSPISCAWNAEKEIGGLHIDLSDGAGHLITIGIDAPPVELGVPKLDVISTDLPTPVKTTAGFNISGDSDGNITVKFDTKEDKPKLTIAGTLEVTCPKKK